MNVEHFPQVNNFYCGPASGKMMLKNLRAGYSRYNGDPQDQAHIGNKHHMDTWLRESTPWRSQRFVLGLNRWREGSNIGWYVQVDSPTVTQYKQALSVDVQTYSAPFGNSTVEFKNGPHYNGHPSTQTIGHWIVTSAYMDYGNTTRFSDPATSVWGGVNATFNYATSSFVNTFLQSNGIAW